MRMNVVTGAIALTLASSVLAGCGGGSSNGASGSYCSDLKADKTYFEGFSGSSKPDLAKLNDVFTRMHTLANEAPSSVSSDWETLDGALTTLQNALKEAGISPTDLAQMANGQTPKGVDLSKLQALAPKLQALDSSAVSDAANHITADAKKSCGVDLSGG
jgi:hypothetical protein